MYRFNIPSNIETISLRDWVRSVGISLTQWRKIKRLASIRVNGELCVELPMLKGGDCVEIDLAIEPNNNLLPQQGCLDILYEDEHLLIVSKPAGMLVHPTVNSNQDTLGNFIMGYYERRGYSLGFHPVSRLDRQTSGVVLIAKTPHVQYLLSGQRINKLYLAIMPGGNFEKMVVDKPIARKLGSIIEREVNELAGDAAKTSFEVLAEYNGWVLVRAQLFTGRTHQIRVHAAYINRPLLGDDLYGYGSALLSRQALHAYSLQFAHPILGYEVVVRDLLPTDMQSVIKRIKCEGYGV